MGSPPAPPLDRTASAPGRPYGGVAAAQRSSIRRARLLEAAIQLMGANGYRALRLRTLCEAAGLTQRYLYESFASIEDVLSAVLDTITEENMRALVVAAGDGSGSPRDVVHRVVSAFVDSVASDPRRCRIQFIEVVGVSPRIEAQRRSAMRTYASFVATGVRALWSVPADIDVDRTAVAYVGAVEELLVAWVHGEVDPDAPALADTLTSMAVRSFGLPTEGTR